MSIIGKIKSQLRPKDYFLVIGAGRGGTSLLAAMLDSHPALTVGMELFAFDYLLGEKLETHKADNLNARINAFNKSCQAAARKAENPWGNKITTEQIAALETTEGASWPTYINAFCATLLKNRKVIFIVRDGRACVNSKMKRTGQSYDEALTRWKLSIAMLNDFKEKNVNLHVCRYEDLIEQPERELSTMAAFLGTEFNMAMLEGPANPKMPEIYQGNELKREEAKKDWPEEWTDALKIELEQLGYL